MRDKLEIFQQFSNNKAVAVHQISYELIQEFLDYEVFCFVFLRTIFYLHGVFQQTTLLIEMLQDFFF